jgi:hypothetical protein
MSVTQPPAIPPQPRPRAALIAEIETEGLPYWLIRQGFTVPQLRSFASTLSSPAP